MAEWVCVCRFDEIPTGRGRPCEASGLRIAVFRVRGFGRRPVRSLPPRGGLARPGLGRGRRGSLPLASLEIQAQGRPLHDHARKRACTGSR